MDFEHLGLGQSGHEVGALGSRTEEGIGLEGHHWSGVEPEGPGVLSEVCQDVGRVEKANLWDV